MRIGIELRQTTLGEAGGISLLLKGVLERLFLRYPRHQFFVFSTIFNRGLLRRTPDNVVCHTLPIVSFFPDLDRIADREGIQVLLRSYPIEDPIGFPLERQIFLIPDLQHEFYPEFFAPPILRSRRIAFHRALSYAGAIATISEHARQTLVDYEWTRCPDIFLMSPALQVEHEEASEASLSDAERALIPDPDFFLFPANLWPHKNHRRTLQAFEHFLNHTRRQVRFLFTGHPDGWEQHRTAFPRLPIQHLGFVRPQLLRVLLRRARALVYFSLFEGFGMPLLEAFHAGTPVICGHVTSLPEVGSDAVLSCDPTDIAAMSRLMARILEDEPLRGELIVRGKKRLSAYSWEKSARNLMEALERVARRSERKTIRGPRLFQESRFPPAAVPQEELPLVSIITPSYNQGRFLKRTIDSVLTQSYPKIEYLVMDGGSTDESVAILCSYGDRFYWVSQRDGGQSQAINRGFARAQGEILSYLNSDDVLLPDAVWKVVRHFQGHPECDMVYGKAHHINEQDQITGMYPTAEYSFDRIMLDDCVCQPAAFWRARMAKKIGLFNEALHYAMDYDYWLRMDRAGGCLQHLPEFLASSRLYAETKTLSARLKVYREIFDVCQVHGGRVSLSYFYGLWHHRCWECTEGWPYRLRRLPKFFKIMSRIHYVWYHRRQMTPPEFAARFGRFLMRRFGLRWNRWQHLGEWVKPVAKRLRAAPRVPLVWPDNWLGPYLRVPFNDKLPGQRLRLIGTPAKDMTLTVRTPAGQVSAFPLRSGQIECIEFQVKLRPGQEIELCFSDAIVDGGQRRLSFLLQETNLFTERDMHVSFQRKRRAG